MKKNLLFGIIFILSVAGLFGQSVPGTPTLLQGQIDYDGYFNLEWTASSGATIYEVWECPDTTFTGSMNYYWPSVNNEWIYKPQSGLWYYKVRAWNDYPESGGSASAWSNVIFQEVDLNGADIFVLGDKNYSDSEFLQSNFQLDFYTETQSVSSFPKELNLSWYQNEYIHFDLTVSEANNPIVFILDPAWNDGSGSLKIAAEFWDGTGWIEAGTATMNMDKDGIIEIAPAFLKIGNNDMRLRAVSGTNGTTVVTWDQITCKSLSNNTIWSIGTNDDSEAEFDNSFFDVEFFVDSEPASEFPKELNTFWYSTEYIKFDLAYEESIRSAAISLDAMWNDGWGKLTVGIERWNGSEWEMIGSSNINKDNPGVIIVSSNKLNEGFNEWRINALRGTDNTSVIVWDKISLYQTNSNSFELSGNNAYYISANFYRWVETITYHDGPWPVFHDSFQYIPEFRIKHERIPWEHASGADNVDEDRAIIEFDLTDWYYQNIDTANISKVELVIDAVASVAGTYEISINDMRYLEDGQFNSAESDFGVSSVNISTINQNLGIITEAVTLDVTSAFLNDAQVIQNFSGFVIQSVTYNQGEVALSNPVIRIYYNN